MTLHVRSLIIIIMVKCKFPLLLLNCTYGTCGTCGTCGIGINIVCVQ